MFDLPSIPNNHALAVLILTVIALYLFRREDIPLETSCLAVLLLVTVGFEIFPYVPPAQAERIEATQFFSGFGHEALVSVCALMMAGQGLVRTGALEPIGRVLAKVWKTSPVISLLLTLIVGAVLSAFMNNTPIVVLLLPILISVSLKTKSSASSVLMPMGLGTLVGGMSTTIGTSTNLLVVSVAADMGMRRLDMFDFMPAAAIAGAVAIVYLWLIAPRIIPERTASMSDSSPRLFTAHLTIQEDGYANGKTLAEVINQAGGHMKVERIQRGEETDTRILPMPDVVLNAGDRLRVSDTPDNLKEYESSIGARLFKGKQMVDDEHPLVAEDQQLAEVVVVPGSPLAGSTLKNVRFIDQFKLVAIALHRGGKAIDLYRKLGNVSLHVGDVLLVQGPRENISKMKKEGELLVLDATTDLPHSDKAPVALGIMASIIFFAALGILPISVSALCGVILMLITRCMSWRDASLALSTQVVLIVVASLALGEALLLTGGADYLAQSFVAVFSGAPPVVILSGLMLLLAILTNVVSNNAAAVIGTPIAISVASQLQLSPEPFVIAVLFGANMSYATPVAYKTNLLVMNAGGYQFSDFVRIGGPLVILMWIVLSFVVPMLHPLTPS
ncbi:SLC13 family permease [Pleionea mediterranea]|uniref:Di/tricarboxylate transporter n=1 Tax=Pleionea mediterranea TaxID=523701 RepID=A0A316FEK6_9GAMM|nr:SLC13 family permease [Pleionea mediterranea]PWK46859.1 di/tricarboxylate transporter [Pleionea mediterranea]